MSKMKDIFFNNFVEYGITPSDMYYIIITCEADDQSLMYYAEYPEKGTLIAIQWFSNKKELIDMVAPYEGMFYQLFDNRIQKRISYGIVDPMIGDDFETEVA